MRKILLFAALAAASTLPVSAENSVHFFKCDYSQAQDGSNMDYVYGFFRNVSPNGKWAVGADYDFERYAFVWNAEDPENLTIINNARCNDVDNSGRVVGEFLPVGADLYMVPGIYENGQWTELDKSDDCIGEATATCVTPDGRFIGGYQYCRATDSELGGRYYPCLWTQQTDGSYSLRCYNDLVLPAHQGFTIDDITDDGSTMCGTIYAPSASELCGLMVNGELKMFNTYETKSEPFEYKGEIIGYFDEFYIDGHHDTAGDMSFIGGFRHFDQQGNCYGHRTTVTDLAEGDNGMQGKLHHAATIYNMEKDEFTDDDCGNYWYFGGLNPDIRFADGGIMVVEGEKVKAADYLGINPEQPLAGVTAVDAQGKIIAVTGQVFNPAAQVYEGIAAIVTMEEPLVPESGINELNGGNDAAQAVYYDLMGRRVANPQGGVFVKVAGGKATKVAL